jgi:hypothetical protein
MHLSNHGPGHGLAYRIKQYVLEQERGELAAGEDWRREGIHHPGPGIGVHGQPEGLDALGGELADPVVGLVEGLLRDLEIEPAEPSVVAGKDGGR